MIIPKKSLGQNFLRDINIVKKILRSTKITGENILEIGPGLGALTEELINLKPRELIIIEKDIVLFEKLENKFHKIPNLQIIYEDALKFDYSKLNNFKIISNLPYNISSKFIIKVFKYNKNISEITCMIQSELADKFNYKIGNMNKYKFLSEFYCSFEQLFKVSPNAFYPKPKVNSKVVKFKLNKKNIDHKKLELFVKLLFINKRKKIKSNNNILNLVDSKIAEKRFEDLNFNEILAIYKKFNFSFS